MFLKLEAHACERVQRALDEKGIEYEVVKHPLLNRNRTELKELSGQTTLPVLELADGRGVREESKVLAEKIRSGELP
jgi:glutathione S-transferase